MARFIIQVLLECSTPSRRISAFHLCDTRSTPLCQKIKGRFPKLGHLPPKSNEINSWEEVKVDLVGPWIFFKVNSILSLSFYVWLPLILSQDYVLCNSCKCLLYYVVDQLSRPLRIIHDQGSETKGPELTFLLKHFGIQNVCITIRNSWANSIIERMHQTLPSMFRSLLLDHKQQDCLLTTSNLDNWVTMAIASWTNAINETIHTTTKTSPGAFVFQRDMVFPIQCQENLDSKE